MDKRCFMYRQFLCVMPICWQFFMIGIARGWIAPILNEASDPHSELPLTTEQSSWIASLGYITRAFSPLLLFPLVDKIGRNSIIVFNAFVNLVVWIAVYGSRNVLVHYVLRLMCGLSDGFLDFLSGIYVCENCSPGVRGTLFTVAVLFLFAGHFVVFVLATFCSYNTTAIINTAFGVVAVASTFLLVEPAQYFLMKGNVEKAEESFARLRDMNDPTVLKEFEALKKNIEQEKSKTFSLQRYRAKEVTRSIRLVLIILSLCSGCGWGAIVAFVTKLLSHSKSLSANEFSMLYGTFQFICVGASSTIMDRFDRRTLLMVSGALLCIIHVGFVLLYSIQPLYEIPYFDAILFILLTSFSCLCAMFLFPLIGILRGELLPQSVKMMGSGLSTFMMAAVSFLVARTFLPIAEAFGMEINFVIYSCSAVLLVVYAYLDLPETRGKTLVEIQDMLKGVGESANKLESSHL